MSKHKFIPTFRKNYESQEDEHLTIPLNNSKLGKIANISLVPMRDCVNFSECSERCYANKFYKMYPSVNKAWDKNSRIFHSDVYRALKDMRDFLKEYKQEYFRIHVAGDFINQTHYEFWNTLAREYPKIKFLAFTKNFSLNYTKVSNNLKIIFSVWSTMKKLPTGQRLAFVNDGVETRHTKAFVCPSVKDHKITCEKCKYCWDKDGDVVFDLH